MIPSRITHHASRIALLLLLLCSALRTPHSAFAATPFSFQFYNSDGTPQTNVMTMVAWPRATNTFAVYGTNIVYGGREITLTPGTNGYGTNFAYPNNYRIYISNYNASLSPAFFFVALPDSTQQVALGSCVVGVPQVAGPVTIYGMFTNAFGFAPLASNALSVKGALTYTPATNSLAGISNAIGFDPATNGLANLTNLLTDAAIVGIHAYRPASNNADGIKFALGYTPATNSYAGITNALGGTLQEISLPQIGRIGVTNLNGAMVTNLATGQIILFTNLTTGTAPTIALPNGSLIITTNGNAYIMSNATAINLK